MRWSLRLRWPRDKSISLSKGNFCCSEATWWAALSGPVNLEEPPGLRGPVSKTQGIRGAGLLP